MADFFDDRLALTVLVRDRRYRMKIHFDVAEVKETDARLDTITLPPPAPTRTESGTGDVSALIQLAAKYHDEGNRKR